MSETKLTAKALANLIDEVDALCRVYVGKNAPGEQWRDTLDRIDRLAKLSKKARAALSTKEG